MSRGAGGPAGEWVKEGRRDEEAAPGSMDDSEALVAKDCEASSWRGHTGWAYV